MPSRTACTPRRGRSGSANTSSATHPPSHTRTSWIRTSTGFLLGRTTDTHFTLDLKRWPLRWASGGIVSMVRYQNRWWTPFFFRDIPPYGWNIALGASERGDDLDRPHTFVFREFLEETLVLGGRPRAGHPMDFKPFIFDHLNIAREMRRADSFAAQHLRARAEKDGLSIRRPGPRPSSERVLFVDTERTNTDLIVRSKGREHVYRNCFVCLNLLKLGIEVVRVVEYELKGQDCILDGELYEVGAQRELVRMPVALISHDYLRGALLEFRDKLVYTDSTQPSIEMPLLPEEHIRIFPFDPERRRALAQGADARATAWERSRYRAWVERFGENFFNAAGEVTCDRASRLFTPTSVKVMSYYFASLDAHGR